MAGTQGWNQDVGTPIVIINQENVTQPYMQPDLSRDIFLIVIPSSQINLAFVTSKNSNKHTDLQHILLVKSPSFLYSLTLRWTGTLFQPKLSLPLKR